MLRLFNLIITTAPFFEDNEFVGFPMNAILNWPMATPAGLALFVNPKVNAQFKRLFDVWSSFLESPDSRYVLTEEDRGWFGPAARRAMPNFATTFVCDTSEQYWGLASWDDFFTRRFREGVRPVHGSDNDADTVITSACESTVYRIARKFQARDRFWLKGEPYSLEHMLNHDDLAPRFAGGTIYQAYLNALDYHRWHSPVNGTIVKTVRVPGAYYAESPDHGFPDPDPSASTGSQGYITAVATRALVFIEAENPGIGLTCFVAVGMAEVSTCEVHVRAGQTVKKGEELGTFRYGGSTHCLIFRPEVELDFAEDVRIGKKVPVNSMIATVRGLSTSRYNIEKDDRHS